MPSATKLQKEFHLIPNEHKIKDCILRNIHVGKDISKKDEEYRYPMELEFEAQGPVDVNDFGKELKDFYKHEKKMVYDQGNQVEYRISPEFDCKIIKGKNKEEDMVILVEAEGIAELKNEQKESPSRRGTRSGRNYQEMDEGGEEEEEEEEDEEEEPQYQERGRGSSGRKMSASERGRKGGLARARKMREQYGEDEEGKNKGYQQLQRRSTQSKRNMGRPNEYGYKEGEYSEEEYEAEEYEPYEEEKEENYMEDDEEGRRGRYRHQSGGGGRNRRMTTREAGRMGGEARARQMEEEYGGGEEARHRAFQEMGRKGGQTRARQMQQKYGGGEEGMHRAYQELGRMGGRGNKSENRGRQGEMTTEEAGQMGGRTRARQMEEEYGGGREAMHRAYQEMGRKGGQSRSRQMEEEYGGGEEGRRRGYQEMGRRGGRGNRRDYGEYDEDYGDEGEEYEEDEEGYGQRQRGRSGGKMSAQERGRKGGLARARKLEEEYGGGEEGRRRGYQEMGRRGGRGNRGRNYDEYEEENDYGEEEEEEDYPQTPTKRRSRGYGGSGKMSPHERGIKAAAARWGKNPADYEEGMQSKRMRSY